MLKYAVQREHFRGYRRRIADGPLGKRRFWLIPAFFVLARRCARCD